MLRSAETNGGTKHKIAFDHTGVSSPFTSPELFSASSPRGVSPEFSEAAMSPTSILQMQAMALSPTACSSNSSDPFFHAKNLSGDTKHHPWDAKPVGLGLVDALGDDGGAIRDGTDAKAMAPVVIGSKLRVQVTPQFTDTAPLFSPRRRLSPREMELSEDYTRVIARGPNPRTTHIFDNCVVESCGFSDDRPGRGPAEFLRACHACNKDLGQGKDIFMYRGEKAFCSSECRYQEMISDEGMEEC